MKRAVLAMILMAGSVFAGPRFTVGIGFGVPAVAVVRPVCPGPGYLWVAGYYGPTGVFVPGFWRAPEVAVTVGQRFIAPHYFVEARGREFRREFHR